MTKAPDIIFIITDQQRRDNRQRNGANPNKTQIADIAHGRHRKDPETNNPRCLQERRLRSPGNHGSTTLRTCVGGHDFSVADQKFLNGEVRRQITTGPASSTAGY